MATVPDIAVTVRVETVPCVDSDTVPYWGPRVIETKNPWMGNCQACGHRYSWEDKQCGHCGAQLPAEAD